MRIPLPLLLPVLLLLPGPVSAAGFDCISVEAPVEFLICNDPVLNALDEEMTRLYRAAQQGDSQRRTQRDWLASRLNRCGIPARGPELSLEERWRMAPCLVGLYRERVTALGGQVEPLPKPVPALPHPLCLYAALSPFGEGEIPPIDMQACAKGNAHIPVEQQADGWVSASGADLGTGTWTAYRIIAELDGGSRAAIMQFNTGGTGVFSSLVTFRDGKTLTLEPLIGGGDRCNGGIADARYDKPDWIVRFSTTPADMAVELDVPETYQEELPYCAICCVGEVEVRFDPEGSEEVQALIREDKGRAMQPETPAEICLLRSLGQAPRIPAAEFPAVRARFEACMAGR